MDACLRRHDEYSQARRQSIVVQKPVQIFLCVLCALCVNLLFLCLVLQYIPRATHGVNQRL